MARNGFRRHEVDAFALQENEDCTMCDATDLDVYYYHEDDAGEILCEDCYEEQNPPEDDEDEDDDNPEPHLSGPEPLETPPVTCRACNDPDCQGCW